MGENKPFRSSLVCIGESELLKVKGGAAAVACLENLWGYVQKAFDFVKEYRKEIINGLKRGWNNF